MIFKSLKRIIQIILWVLVNILFICSGPLLTGILSFRGSLEQKALGIVASFIVFCILSLKFDFVRRTFKQIKFSYLAVSGVFAMVSAKYFVNYYNGWLEAWVITLRDKSDMALYSRLIDILLNIVTSRTYIGILIIFILFIFWYYFFINYFPAMKNFLQGLDKIEQRFIIISSILLAIALVVIYTTTNVFYLPSIDGRVINYDVIYTTDTGNQMATNVFVKIGAPENDLRQPLFGLYALPFGILATIMAKLLFFLPHSYPISLAVIHVLLLNIVLICSARMLNIKAGSKVLFLLMCVSSYPFLLFAVNMEQYVFPVFWLITFIYVYITDKKYKDVLYIGATGSMLTSGVWFVLLSKSNSLLERIKEIFLVAVKFFIPVTIFGQLPHFLALQETIIRYTRFTGAALTLQDKLIQYSNFVANCFIRPIGSVVTTTEHISYQLDPLSTFNKLGILIVALVVVGFILNYKEKFAQICFAWVLYSFALLCVVGWGTKENGLILYTLYFFWAFISLIFLALEKVFERTPKLKKAAFILIIAAIFVINVRGMGDLIQFGATFYPAIK